MAWFADTSEEIKNIFHFGKFDLEVSYRLPDGSWKPMDGTELTRESVTELVRDTLVKCHKQADLSITEKIEPHRVDSVGFHF